MSDEAEEDRVFLAMPGYGHQTAAAGRAFWFACKNESRTIVKYQAGSLLACNFNMLWATALNMQRAGIPIKYFAMLHDDIGPEDHWLDTLIEEMEAKELDMLGVVVPIKDNHGLTSIALDNVKGYSWAPHCRLTMKEVFELPETFTSKDVGGMNILLNTGCWVCKFDTSWNDKVHFTINDRIVFDKPKNSYVVQVESEDWFFSRLCHEQGLKIGATRKVKLTHRGEVDFANVTPWGEWSYDQSFRKKSVTQELAESDDFKFPDDVEGWLTYTEGKALAELARGKRVLEIGSYCGRSTICLAQTASRVVAVDPFDGRATPLPKETLREFLANIKRYKVNEKIATKACTSREYAHRSELVGRDDFFDLVFIDGAHDYKSVKQDIEDATLLLADGGLLAFHDYRNGRDPGVDQAVDELVADGAEILSIHGCLVVVRPSANIGEVCTPAVALPPALVYSED